MHTTTQQLVVVHAGTSDPSSTQLLADQVVAQVAKHADANNSRVETKLINLKSLATDIMNALVTGLTSPELQHASDVLAEADGIIASTPIYKAGPSGLFVSFFQVLDNDLLIGKPVILSATAGSARHALVIDDQMRTLFAYLRTLPVPTAVFAAPDDWNSPELSTRVDRAAIELNLLMESNFSSQVREQAWGKYQHNFGSAGGTETSIDLSTDLMGLAAGGAAPSQS